MAKFKRFNQKRAYQNMMAIRTKLTLLVLVLYFIVMAILLVLLFNVYGPLVLSTFISLIPLTFLIEKLRDSLSEKLGYLQDNIFSGIYSSLKLYDDNYLNTYFSESIGEIKEKQSDLKIYSHFIGISLFPKKLLEKNDNFILIRELLFRKLKFVLDSVYENMKSQGVFGSSDFGKYTVLKYLDFDVDTTLINYSSAVFIAAKRFEKENPHIAR
jgi:hypothetical protein